MSRLPRHGLLRHGLLLLALCWGGCEGTETGNPDPSIPRPGHHQDAGPPERDGGSMPGFDSGVTSDASVPSDAGGALDASPSDAGADDAGGGQDAGEPAEDGGDEDAGA